ncbi:MAG: MMPL family transporter [Parvularculaceae bacterium]|nr:MMPL family transporter [Parvularculaceae bacterium]
MLNALSQTLSALADVSRRAGVWLLIIFAASTGAAGWYAATALKVDTDTSAMIDQTLDFEVRAKELRAAFPEIKSDVTVVVRAPTPDEADAFASALAARVGANGDAFAGVFALSADPFFRANGLLYLDTEELEKRLTQMSKASGLIETLVKAPTAGQLFATLADNDALAERSELGRDTLQSIYAELAGVIEASNRGETRPFSWMGAIAGEMASDKAVMRTVQVSPKLDYARLQPAKPALTALRADIDALKSENPRVEAFITGDPALRADELASVANGIEISFLISFISVGALLWICFRSLPLTLITLASLVTSIVLTAAFAAFFIGKLNLVSVAFTVLMVGLGIDYAVHLLLHVQERRAEGLAAPEALRTGMGDVGAGLILACLTTALGFLAFVPTDFDGIAQLGLIAGAGVIIALFVSLTLIPAAVGVFGVKARSSTSKRQGADPFAHAKTAIAIATVIAGLLSVFLLPQSRFDADPMSLRDPKSLSVQGFNLLVDDAETSPYRVTRLVGSEEEAADTAVKARTLETVRSVRTLLNFIPADQEEKLDLISYSAGALAFALEAAEDKSASPSAEAGARALKTRLEGAYDAASPAGRLAVALGAALDSPENFAAIEKNIFAYWPALMARLREQLAADYVDAETLPDKIKRRYLSDDGQWRVDILPAADGRDPKALAAFVKSVEAVFPDVAGGAVQSQKSGETIARAMIDASLIALAVITVFLFLLLRRVADVALMLFPIALAASLTIAAGVILNIPFNYANVIVLPLLLGIGVDSGIHLVLRERHQEAGGKATRRAVFFAALTTIASFGSLTLSSHRGTASMGELLSIAIGFTLLCTLVVLPVTMRLVRRKS